MNRPFMEHPAGGFETAADAMADAVERLRALPVWNNWIEFTAQGVGGRLDSYHLAEIRMRRNELQVENLAEIDVVLVTCQAGVPKSCLSKNGDVYSIANTSPVQAARIVDMIFRHYLGICPHAGEGDDYPVGAEWV